MNCVLCMLVWKGRLSGGVPGLTGYIQNIVDGSCVPFHTILLLYRINHFYLSYETLKQASHNILIDTKDGWDRPHTTCPHVATLW